MLADLLAVLPRVLLLAGLEGAVLSLFASPSTHCWYVLLGFHCSQMALGDSGQRVHMAADTNWSIPHTVCADSECWSPKCRPGDWSSFNIATEWAQLHPFVEHHQRTAAGIQTVTSSKDASTEGVILQALAARDEWRQLKDTYLPLYLHLQIYGHSEAVITKNPRLHKSSMCTYIFSASSRFEIALSTKLYFC